MQCYRTRLRWPLPDALLSMFIEGVLSCFLRACWLQVVIDTSGSGHLASSRCPFFERVARVSTPLRLVLLGPSPRKNKNNE